MVLRRIEQVEFSAKAVMDLKFWEKVEIRVFLKGYLN